MSCLHLEQLSFLLDPDFRILDVSILHGTMKVLCNLVALGYVASDRRGPIWERDELRSTSHGVGRR